MSRETVKGTRHAFAALIAALRTTTTTKPRSALSSLSPETEIGTQLPLPSVSTDAIPQPQRRRRRPRPDRPVDDLFDLFRARLDARLAPKSVTTYCWSLRHMLAFAEELGGHPLSVADLITDTDLLGQICATARRPGGPEAARRFRRGRSIRQVIIRISCIEATMKISDGIPLIIPTTLERNGWEHAGRFGSPLQIPSVGAWLSAMRAIVTVTAPQHLHLRQAMQTLACP